MKHKILLFTESSEDLIELTIGLKSFLRSDSEIYITNYSDTAAILETEGAYVGGDSIKSTFETRNKWEVIRETKKLGVNLELKEWHHEDHDIAEQSVIYDLAVFSPSFITASNPRDLLALISSLNCAVLTLSKEHTIDEVLLLSDGSREAIKMTKAFLSAFNKNFRSLPLSVFLGTPNARNTGEREKAYVEYLKMFFKDIGIQVLCQDPFKCISEQIRSTESNYFLIPVLNEGENDLEKVIHDEVFRKASIFLFRP